MAKPHSSYSGWVNGCLTHHLSVVPLIVILLAAPLIVGWVLMTAGVRAAGTFVARNVRDAHELTNTAYPPAALRTLVPWVAWCVTHRMKGLPLVLMLLLAPVLFLGAWLGVGLTQAAGDLGRNIAEAFALMAPDQEASST